MNLYEGSMSTTHEEMKQKSYLRMNFAVDLPAGFLIAIITDPSVLRTNNTIGMIIQTWYRIELIIQHES